ncbi:NAD-dependent epimerase/dehydratase family protein [Thalassovita aquimarina]|uniref:NAD-dependent epimerase/dehydratase family protein n=1 Tax=Thalassovita aquimarina TaxID=2785917 RepID=UPI0035636DC5
MRFLVTGGAGFLGINLVRHLLAQGHQVRSYDIAPFDYPEADRIDVLTGDIRDLDLHDKAFEDVDMVVHCAAALPLCTREEIMSTDVGGTTKLLQTAQAKGTRRFIHISSTAVYGVPDHHPLYEDDKMIGVGPYGEAKVEAEKVCAKFRDNGLCVPVLRPKSFVGPERLGVFELLYDFAYTGHGFPILGKGDNLYQLLDVEDLCDAISLCADGDRDAVNDVFNVGAAEFGSFRDSFQAVLDRAGHGKRIKGIPAGPAILTLRLLEKLHLSPLYAWIYETAAKDSFVSIDKICDRLGFVPKYSNRDALIRNYDWYVANRDHIARRAGVTHRVPWKKGALELVRHFM